PIHADQVIQALFSGDLQRPQPAATALAHPAGGKGGAPVQWRCRWWQGLFIAVEEADNPLHEFGSGDIAHGPSGSDDVQARDSNRRHTESMQQRNPVGGGPSGKTCPRWASQRARSTSIRCMPWLKSSAVAIAASLTGAQ